MQGTAAAEWARSQSGRRLGGRWRLGPLLGLGGSAAVFEATHRNGKRVAIKLLRPERALDPRARARFLREGYAANRVGHARVVSVDDDGEEPDGTAFLVMELLSGEPLDVYAARAGGKLPWRRVAGMTTQLLEVLQAAHQRGIVHRDIKPANLFWSDAAGLRVLDFGLAQVPSPEDGVVTQDGALLGTPAFMAPEQARAAASSVTELTDLWAVGATAFTLLTGRKVYEAPTVDEQLALAAINPAPLLRRLAPEVPPAVAAVWQRALEYDASERWPSASAMSTALAAALRGEPPDLGAEPTPGEVTVTSVQRDAAADDSLGPVSRGRARRVQGRTSVVLLLAVAIALLGAVLSFSVFNGDEETPRAGVASSRPSASPALQSAAPSLATPQPSVAVSARPEPGAPRATPTSRRAAPPRASGPASHLIEEPPF